MRSLPPILLDQGQVNILQRVLPRRLTVERVKVEPVLRPQVVTVNHGRRDGTIIKSGPSVPSPNSNKKTRQYHGNQ